VCLLVISSLAHPRYRLVIAANRDEFHERPTAPLDWWTGTGDPAILGGRDLRAGGTWLALDAARRLGIVTNYRDLQRSPPGAPSRGALIPDYLAQPVSAAAFLAALAASAQRYSGFNLLLADADALWYGSNRATPFARALPPGIYGLSNHLLDTPWPKLARVRRGFEAWLRAVPAPPAEQLFDLLADRTPATGAEAAESTTGLAPEWQRVLSAPFVVHPLYGTRSSTLVLLEASGAGLIHERRFDASGQPSGETVEHLAPLTPPLAR
jgi:uncharacterized protein with NRDE domain